MEDKPISKKDILKELNEIQSKDHKYSDGRILGSMCTEAHPFAKEVYCKFLDSNLGDPGLFKGTKYIENEVIKSIGELLSISEPYGNIVTGGTEANIMAMRAARNHARKYNGIKEGEIIIPDSAHFSFKKAADMMKDMELIRETEQAAEQLLQDDPTLQQPGNQGLRLEVLRLFAKTGENGVIL